LRDTEFFRLLDSDPPRLWSEKKRKEWDEKDLDKVEFDIFGFSVSDPGRFQADRLCGAV
jgi:hypothetical protein